MAKELPLEASNPNFLNGAGNVYSFFVAVFLALPSPFAGDDEVVLGVLEIGGAAGVDAAESLLAALLYPSLR